MAGNARKVLNPQEGGIEAQSEDFSLDDFDVTIDTEADDVQLLDGEDSGEVDVQPETAAEKPKEDAGDDSDSTDDTTDEPELTPLTTPPVDDNATPSVEDQDDADLEEGDGPQQLSKGRDYSQFLEEDIPLLKKLPNHSFNQVKDRFADRKNQLEEYNRLKEQKGNLPDSYYQAPDAYLLDPDYQRLVRESSTADELTSYYTQQYQLYKQGKPFNIIEGVDEQGKYKIKTIQPFEEKDEDGNVVGTKHSDYDLFFNQRVTELSTHRSRINGHLEQFENQYANHFQTLQQGVSKLSERLFPDQVDQEKNPYKKDYDLFISQMPSSFKGHPLLDLTAKGYAAFVNVTKQQADEIKKLKAELAKKQGLIQDQQRSGPANRANGVTPQQQPKGDIFDFDAF